MADINVPVKTLLDEVSFKLDKEFTLYMMLSGHESDHDYIFQFVHSANTDLERLENVVQAEEMPTEHYGSCTIVKVSEKLKGSIKLKNKIIINFKTEDVNELSLANIFFTSEENVHGAALRQWTEGEVYALAIDPRQNLDYAVSLKNQIRKRLMGSSYCNPDRGYYKCFAER